MLPIILSITQAICGGLLLIGTLRTESPDKFRHRGILFLFAALGSGSLTSSLVYFNEYLLERSLLVFITFMAISILFWVNWNIPKLCHKIHKTFTR